MGPFDRNPNNPGARDSRCPDHAGTCDYCGQLLLDGYVGLEHKLGYDFLVEWSPSATPVHGICGSGISPTVGGIPGVVEGPGG